MNRRHLRLILLSLVIVLVTVLAFSSSASADNCSGQADCERTGGYETIIAVVGGAGAVAAAAAAAIADVEADSDEEGEREVDLAIVQVSVAALTVEDNNPASLTLTGWHVGEEGQKRVPMPLWLEVPEESGLVAEPESGEGELVTQIRIEKITGETEALIEAVGEWNGDRASATVTVTILGEYGLRLY